MDRPEFPSQCGPEIMVWPHETLPIGQDGISTDDLAMWARHQQALVWNLQGYCRVLPSSVLQEMQQTHEAQIKLFKRGRFELMDTKQLVFRYNQTISLEEYFQDIGKPPDTDT